LTRVGRDPAHLNFSYSRFSEEHSDGLHAPARDAGRPFRRPPPVVRRRDRQAVRMGDAIGDGMLPKTRVFTRREPAHTWCTVQFEERKAEPNSGLGQAISYLLKHWQKLTLFLEKPGVPLDNNIVERALKKAILHRKNSLFYKTRKGAQMGDLFMSLIHTCELNGVNAFDYLTELQRHVEELKQNPSAWMPWNYRETLARLATPAAA
jgi:hypothetical protein